MLLAVAEQYSVSLIVYLMFLICCMIETNGSILAGSVRCCVLPRLHCGPSSSGHKAMCVSVTVCQAEAETEGAELSIALILALMFELANQTRTVAKKCAAFPPPPPPPAPPALPPSPYSVGHILRHLFLLLAGHSSWLATRQIETQTPLNWQP